MAKKDIRDKKNKEAEQTFIKEAVKLGLKEDDPLIKESIEKIVNTKGSSVGRKKIIEQHLLKLKKNLEVTSGKIVMSKEELQKLIDEKVKEATSNIEKSNEELIEKLAKEKAQALSEQQINEILSKVDELSKVRETVEVYVINNYIEKESLLHKAYDATKETVVNATKKTKETATRIKDATVEKATITKDATVETVGKIKDATVETVDKIKDVTVETADKIKEATMETTSKVKDATVEAASKIKDTAIETTEKGLNKVKSFGSKFKDNAIKQKNKQINHVLTFFEKVKDNTKEAKNKVKDKINEHKEKKALEKERKAIEKENKALERERKLVERELKNAQKKKELSEKEKQVKEIDDLEQDNNYMDTIFKTRIMGKSKEIADSYGIDFEDEAINQKVSEEIDRIKNYEDLSREEDVIGYITNKIKNLYKEHNKEIMRQRREAQKQKEPKIAEPKVIDSNNKEVENNNFEVDTMKSKDVEVEDMKAKDVREFLFGSEQTGFKYIEQEDGTIHRIFMNGGKEQSLTIVSRKEFEERRERYLNSNNEKEVDKSKKQEVDMSF